MHPRSWLRAALSRVLYPLMLAGSVLLARVLLGHGVGGGVAVTLVILTALVVVTGLERLMPYRREWNVRAGDLPQDVAYLGIGAVMQPIARGVAEGAVAAGVLALHAAWPTLAWSRRTGLGTWALALLGLAASDLVKYVIHRKSHESAWLFRFHAAHHAPERIYGLNGIRLHPVNLLWNLVPDALVPLALGLGGTELVLVAAFRGTVAALQHANVELRLGPLDWIFSTPTLHRMHHATNLADANSNYGSTFIVWDLLFGTRNPPRPNEPATLGLADGVQPPRLAAQLLWPWCEARAATCRLLRWSGHTQPR
ncbi:MAG: sterol desaturase family protein [Polyangiaceae bacterium]|nr:sterol desaturase family protein [Polyangiaceae bacterium]